LEKLERKFACSIFNRKGGAAGLGQRLPFSLHVLIRMGKSVQKIDRVLN